MKCPACQHPNRDGAKFCEDCAAPLHLVCARCGEDLRPTAKFCDECGTPTARGSERPRNGGTPASAGEGPGTATSSSAVGDTSRRVVTVVFADLAGSTALHERLDAESARLFMENYYAAMRRVIDEHGGRVAKLLGDGVMAVFGLPLVGEDDAFRAVRATVSMQAAFRELAEQYSGLVGQIGLRIAANTGEVVARDDSELIGDPVNVAARLQEKARDGDVVVGESTRRLVSTLVSLEPLGSLALKGRAEAVAAHRVVSLDPPKSATTAAFVGREEELGRLQAVYEAAVSEPRTTLAVLLGSPGLGKSRLIDEFSSRVGNVAAVVTADCEAAGGATFAPLASALREFLGISDRADEAELREAIEGVLSETFAERGRIRDGVAALLRGSPAPPEEAFFVIRRLLAALASARPLVLVVDDLQWASPLLLDLVEHLVQWGSGTPLFVLVGARPELRESRSALTNRSAIVADVVALAGLDAGAAMRLAANVIGASDLPAAAAARVLAASEGNPLFVGELVRMLVHEGALEHDGERWIVGEGLASLEMPPTIHALLAARIERLRPEERMVLERAAVVGRQFSRSALAHLLPEGTGDLDARLESLRRSELIEPDTGWFLGEPALRFHHLLIRDAAYRRLLRNTRAELHSRLADWIESKASGSVDQVEHDEIIGWHLEQAYGHLRELGPLDDAGRGLGQRASQRLAAAGRRSLARDDLPVAADLLGRALGCLAEEDADRADLALDWCEALLSAGDVGPAVGAVAELARFTSSSPRLRAWHSCMAGQLSALTEPHSLQATAEAVAAAAREFSELGDDAGEAKAHSVHAQALARLGRVGASEAALDLALAASRRAGDRRRANAVLAGAPLAALWGPSPVTRASGRCLDVVRVLRITQGAPAVEAVALSCQGVLEALRGRTDAARRMVGAARNLVEELGITHRLLEADVCAARIDLLEGDAAGAERVLRPSYQGLRDLGLGSDAAQAGALLGRALLAQGRPSEAEEISRECESLAGDDLQAAIMWRAVRAEALAQRGEHAEAMELAEAGVAIAANTDALLDHAVARLSLAAVLLAAGRDNDAKAERKRARDLWEAKGALWDRTAGAASPAVAEDASEAALERFDALDPARPLAPASSRRRPVQPNAASALTDRVAAAIAAADLAAVGECYRDDFVEVDHVNGASWGKEGNLESVRRMLDLHEAATEFDVLATLGDSVSLVCRRTSGSGSDAGGLGIGPYELVRFVAMRVDAAGRYERTEVFGDSHLGDAVACVVALHADALPPGADRDRAAATARSMAAQMDMANFGDLVAALHPDVKAVDHRVVGFGTLRGREALGKAFSAFLDLTENSAWRVDSVEALTAVGAVLRATNQGQALGGGGFERKACLLFRFDEDGLISNWEMFEADDVDAALARFEELDGSPVESNPAFSASVTADASEEASAKFLQDFQIRFAARDWQGIRDLSDPNLHGRDHRLVSWGTLEGADALVTATSSLVEMAPDTTLTVKHQRFRGRAILQHNVWKGTRDGGEFESPFLCVFELNDRGQALRFDLFDVHHVDDARQRFDEIAGPGTAMRETDPGAGPSSSQDLLRIPPNRASRAFLAWADRINAGDVDGAWKFTMAPGYQAEDRRRVVGLDYDLARAHANDQWMVEQGARISAKLVATAGEHLALLQGTMALEVEGDPAAPAEIDVLEVVEVDPEGRFLADVIFDPDNRVAAQEEMLSRRVRGQAPPAAARGVDFTRAWNRHDLEALREIVPEGYVFDDHRRTGVGRLEGRQAYLASLEALFSLSPDVCHERLYLMKAADHAALYVTRWWGTNSEGGDFEAFYLFLGYTDGDQIGGAEVFELDDLDAALARFESLRNPGAAVSWALSTGSRASGSPPARMTMVPQDWANPHFAAVLRTIFERISTGMAIDDWNPLREFVSPDFRYEDRGRRALVQGDVETWIASLRFVFEQPHLSMSLEPVGSLGRLVAINSLRWWGGTDGTAFEMEKMQLIEVDDQGKVRGVALFDAEDRPVAFLEALRRFADGEGATCEAARLWMNLTRCFLERDWATMLDILHPEFVLEDSRPLSFGRIGTQAWMESLRVQAELAPQRAGETGCILGWGTRALAMEIRVSGTLAEGGSFENVMVCVCRAREGRIDRFEIYPETDRNRAVEGLRELDESAAVLPGAATA